MENKQVKTTLLVTQNASAIGAAIGSMLPVYVAVQNAAFNYLNIFWLSVIIGLIAVGLFAMVVEFGMKVYFPYGIKGLLSGEAFKKGWQTSALFIVITSLAVGLMFSSGYMSFEGRKEAAHLAAGDLKTNNIESIVSSVSANENKNLKDAKFERNRVLKQIKGRKTEIERTNQNLADLAQNGNAWAIGKLQRLKDNDKKIKELESTLKQKDSTVETLIVGASVSKAVETVSKENDLRIETWKERHETSKSLVGRFGIACILIFAFASIVLALYDITEGSTPISKASTLPPSELEPVSGGSVSADRKADAALKQAKENREQIEKLKQSERVSETVSKALSPSVSPEISETKRKSETVSKKKLKQKTETKSSVSEIPTIKDIVSKAGHKAIWVPGFKTEPFSLSQCNSKLCQYQNKLKNKKGKASTNEANIKKFRKAIQLLEA